MGESAAKYLGIILQLFTCVDLSSWVECFEDDITVSAIWSWTQAERAISKAAETFQNTNGLLTAQDNEFHSTTSLYVWETSSLAK